MAASITAALHLSVVLHDGLLYVLLDEWCLQRCADTQLRVAINVSRSVCQTRCSCSRFASCSGLLAFRARPMLHIFGRCVRHFVRTASVSSDNLLLVQA
jgi:hypothetical protein